MSAGPATLTDLERFTAAWEDFSSALRRARSRARQQPAPLTPAQYGMSSSFIMIPQFVKTSSAAGYGFDAR